jgi:copper chaperone
MTRLSVPDMSCGHCKATVEAALAAVPGTHDIVVDLGARTVSVAGDVPVEVLMSALDSVGYPASPAD